MKKNNFYKVKKSQIRFLNKESKMLFCNIYKVIKEKNIGNEFIYKRIGYEVLGPMLYGYTVWLHDQVTKVSANNIVFLSREGEILKKAYETMFGCEEGVNVAYLNVSRVALAKATYIYNKNWADVEDKYATLFRGLETVEEFLSLLDITANEEDYYRKGLNPDTKISDVVDKEKIFELIKNNGWEYLENQNRLALKYFRDNGVGKGKTIISDIGWCGTMQILFEELFPEEKFVGCYYAVGNTYRSEKYQRIDRRGFWFGTEEFHRKWQMIRFTMVDFEFMFLNNEGTTLGYEISNESIKAKKRIESKSPGLYIEETHESALLFVKEFHTQVTNNVSISKINPDIWFIAYQNFAVYPKSETLDFFNNFSVVNGVTEFGILPQRKGIEYLTHPKQLLNEIELSGGKIIWLYGLLRFPLPYYSILCFLTEKIGMKSRFEEKYLVRLINGRKKTHKGKANNNI